MSALKLIIIEKQPHIIQSNTLKKSQKNIVKVSIEESEIQDYEIKLNTQINPIATPIIILFDIFGSPKKRFIPLNQEDISRYRIIKILIEQLDVQKYFPKIEIGQLHCQSLIKGIFEDLVIFNSSNTDINIFSHLTSLSEQYLNCLPLNIVLGSHLNDIFKNKYLNTTDWQMFWLLIPLMGMWDVAAHNILLRVDSDSKLRLVHIDFGDVPLPWIGKKRKLIINNVLLKNITNSNTKIDDTVLQYINTLNSEYLIQKVNEKLISLTDKKVWKKIWHEGKDIEDIIIKMKEIIQTNSSFRQFIEKLFDTSVTPITGSK